MQLCLIFIFVKEISYANHYNPRFVYYFTPFFTGVYIVERLILETIYVLNKKILPFWGLKSVGSIKCYVNKEVGWWGGQMMMFDEQVGGWGWLNAV